MLDKILQKLGLSSKEARVYLATLELGAAPVQQIAKKASVNRPTTYVILESLMKKGLATSVERGKKVLFTAEPPEQLERLLARQQEEIEEKRGELLKILPELEAIFNLSENRPKVKFYEGREGLKASTWEFIRDIPERSTIYAFTPLDDMLRVIPDYNRVSPEERLKKRIRTKVIYTNAEGPIQKATSTKELREARFVPKAKFPFKANINIAIGKKIGVTALGNVLMGIIIESPELADSWKAIFDLAWEAAEKYNTVIASEAKQS